MTHRLDGARLKLDRANEHMDTLEAEMVRYLDRDLYMLVRDEQAAGTVFHLWLREEPPPRFSVMIGDCIHNLRSCLDHVMWQLVLANHATPDEHTAFPILDKPPKAGLFAPNSCRGISKDALALIERMQPYQAGDEARQHVLWFLRELSNTDKHRTLHLTAASLRGIRVRILWGQDERVIAEASLAGGIFRHRTEIAAFPILQFGMLGDDVKVETSGDKFIALQDAGPWGQEEPILHLLEYAHRQIQEGILPQVEALPEMQ